MSTVCCVHVQKRNFAHFRKCRKSAIIAGSQFLAITHNMSYAQLEFLLIHRQLVLPYVMRVYGVTHKNYVGVKNCCVRKSFVGAALRALWLSSSQCHFFVTRASVRISTNDDLLFFYSLGKLGIVPCTMSLFCHLKTPSCPLPCVFYGVRKVSIVQSIFFYSLRKLRKILFYGVPKCSFCAGLWPFLYRSHALFYSV